MGVILPRRTIVNTRAQFAGSLEEFKEGVQGQEFVALNYKCIDCGYETEKLDDMLHHQHYAKHTWWQNIKRALEV